jgi:uncharacterized protein (DUF2252 family)
MNEESSLLHRKVARSAKLRLTKRKAQLALVAALTILLPFVCVYYFRPDVETAQITPIVLRVPSFADGVPFADGGRAETASLDTTPTTNSLPVIHQRCAWVVSVLADKILRRFSKDELKMNLKLLSTDANVFYRATARIFWDDFVLHHWSKPLTRVLDMSKEDKVTDYHGYSHHDPLLVQGKATWSTYCKVSADDLCRLETYAFETHIVHCQTLDVLMKLSILSYSSAWVTGDQHLSNFGAWRNRNNQVVFGVNDFDESAIYDFQADVLRIAVSIVNHGQSNGVPTKDVIHAFAEQYVKTVLGYADNEREELFEMTPKSAKGQLRTFLKKVENKESKVRQIEKFTYRTATTQELRFIKGGVGAAHNETRLATVQPEVEQDIRKAFTSERYGATMMKMGWAVRPWDDAFYKVLDIAARVGSGIGSYGVDRYYVLLQGTDELLEEDGGDGSAIILDVKYQPPGAVYRVLNADDLAWYGVMFNNSAARVVTAQRRLTSYTDPYTGWIMLSDGNGSEARPFQVRQRSPWKATFNLSTLTNRRDFEEFAEQIAIVTATSHVRGSAAAPPGDFKHVIRDLLSGTHRRKKWAKTLSELAHAYREQVVLDFHCVEQYVQSNLSRDVDATYAGQL